MHEHAIKIFYLYIEYVYPLKGTVLTVKYFVHSSQCLDRAISYKFFLFTRTLEST